LIALVLKTFGELMIASLGTPFTMTFENFDQIWADQKKKGAPINNQLYAVGSLGVEFLAGDLDHCFDDPPVPFFSLQRGTLHSKKQHNFEFDFGAGQFGGMVDSNSVFVSPPNTWCRYDVNHSFHLDMVSFPKELIIPLLPKISGKRQYDFGRLHSQAILNPDYSKIIDRLSLEIGLGNPNGKLLIDTAAIRLVSMLIEAAFGVHEETGSLPVATDWRLRRACDWIEANLASDIIITDIARAAGMSISALNRTFRTEFAMSTFQYVRSRRVEKAKKLLTNRRLSIIEVGTEVGYPNSQHFATMFRELTSTTPTSFRANI
jgi:AraC family transcriptional regulator